MTPHPVDRNSGYAGQADATTLSVNVFPFEHRNAEHAKNIEMIVTSWGNAFWNIASVHACLAHPSSCAYLALQDGTCVGLLLVRFVGSTCEILYVYVLEEFRRRGASRALLQDLVKRCVARNTEEIFLDVRASNGPAQELYRRLGFERVALRKSYYADGEDGQVFRLGLDRMHAKGPQE